MDDHTWRNRVGSLEADAEMATLLANCLGVVPELDAWRAGNDDISGAVAADGLDQARGMLERLASGGAEQMLARVESLLADLPAPLE